MQRAITMIAGSQKELGVKPRGWSSIGYHVQLGNEDGFLSLDFGLAEFGPSEMRSAVTSELHGVNDKNIGERLNHYRKFLYEKGEISDIAKEQASDFKLNEWKRLLKDAGASPVRNSASFIFAHAPLRLLTSSRPNGKLRSAFAFCGAPGSGTAQGIS